LIVERLIVSAMRQGDTGGQDLEISAALTAEELVRLVPVALGWIAGSSPDLAFEIVVDPPGRRLLPHETLPQAGAWDGAALTFRPRPALPVQPIPTRTPVADGAPAAGFVWKRLDDE
jgi:hypothetical protein